jgi:pimeloyl-ACP methyl ester carboxylesterase
VRSLEEEEAYLNLIRIRTEGLVEAPYLFHRALQQSPELVEEALQRRLALPVNQVGYRRQLRAPLRWSSLRRLPRLRQPTLVLHGDHDRLIPDINGRLIARLIPGARFHSIKGAGHVYGTDAPGEAAGVVVSFIESQVKRRSGQAAGRLQASGRHG